MSNHRPAGTRNHIVVVWVTVVAVVSARTPSQKALRRCGAMKSIQSHDVVPRG